MIVVGEEMGWLELLLEESVDYYECEVDFDLKSLMVKIEFILIGFVVVMVMILVFGIFMLMWNMMLVVKGGWYSVL